MKIGQLVVVVTLASIFAMAARISVDTDTWWHLRTGTWILENGAIPQTDPFSYTRFGEEWRAPGWLVQVPLAWMYELGGPGLLNVWVALMVTAAFALLWPALEGGVFGRAFITILAAAAAGVYWAARPYMLTFLLAVAFLRILEDWRHGRADRLWWLPVLMVVWANSHGGFAVGVILWGVYLGGELANWRMGEWANGLGVHSFLRSERIRRLLVVGAVMLLAITVNPAGPEMLLYPFKTVAIESLQDYIQEWQSPDFHQRQVWPFAAMIFLVLGAVGVSEKKLALEDFLLTAGWGFMGLLAGRNIAIFALCAAPVLARHAAPSISRWSARLGLRLRPERRPGRLLGIVNTLLAGLVLFAAGVKALSVYPASVNEAAYADFLPVEAVDYIRLEQPPGRLFNAYNWGAYLLWALPEYLVFVDGRTDLYNDEIIGEWFTVVRAEEGWEEILDRWNVRLILTESYLPLTAALEDAGWARAYEDGFASVFRR